MSTFEKLCLILEEELNADTGNLTPETPFYVLGFDSLDLADAIMAAEEQFKLEIPDEAFRGMETLGDICDYIESHI